MGGTRTTAVIVSNGLDDQAFFHAIEQPAYKDYLRSATDEVIQRGGFGSPTIFINHDSK